MEQKPDLKNLSKRVIARRKELDMSHEDVRDCGGPSTTTLSKIEAAREPGPRRDTRKRLELALGWQPGSVLEILRGGEPFMAMTPAEPPRSRPPGRLANLINDYLESAVTDTGELADRVGVSRSTIDRWRTHALTELPKPPETLHRLADAIRLPDAAVFYAAGIDAGYVIEHEVSPDGDMGTG